MPFITSSAATNRIVRLGEPVAPSLAKARISQVKTQNQSCAHVDVEKVLVAQGLEELDRRILRQREQPAASDHHQPTHEGDDDWQRAPRPDIVTNHYG